LSTRYGWRNTTVSDLVSKPIRSFGSYGYTTPNPLFRCRQLLIYPRKANHSKKLYATCAGYNMILAAPGKMAVLLLVLRLRPGVYHERNQHGQN
jgi:hypothetical protein